MLATVVVVGEVAYMYLGAKKDEDCEKDGEFTEAMHDGIKSDDGGKGGSDEGC